MTNIKAIQSWFCLLFARQFWAVAAVLVFILTSGCARDYKDIHTPVKPRQAADTVAEPHKPVVEPNKPAVLVLTPLQPAQPDPNSVQPVAVDPQVVHRIQTQSLSSLAASKWITQGQPAPVDIPSKEKISVTAHTCYHPYGIYDRDWCWDHWGCRNQDYAYPYRYPAERDFYNHNAVQMNLDASVSFEFGYWTLY